MARALDFCDSMAPGPHPGSAVIPAALAAAELAGACSGRDFISAVAVGTEVASRLNLSEAAYNGFDPTGICVLGYGRVENPGPAEGDLERTGHGL
jgi:hypothetical protein